MSRTKHPFSFILPHSKILQERLPGGVMLTSADPAAFSSVENRVDEKVCVGTIPSNHFRKQVFILPGSSAL